MGWAGASASNTTRRRVAPTLFYFFFPGAHCPRTSASPHQTPDLNPIGLSRPPPLFYPPRSILPQVDAIKFLVASGAKLSVEAIDGISPLHFACQKGHWDAARELVNSGANPKALTYKKENALHFAAGAGNKRLVEMLLKRRTNPMQRNKKGKRPSEVAKDPAIVEVLQVGSRAQLRCPFNALLLLFFSTLLEIRRTFNGIPRRRPRVLIARSATLTSGSGECVR